MLQLRVLGPPDLTDSDGNPVEGVTRHPKRVGLLAYLGLYNHGGFVQRDRLLHVFWPDADSARARNALNQMIHQLRSYLGDDAIVARGRTELRLNSRRVWCDGPAFHSAVDASDAARAVDWYRGELLEGFYLSNTPAFEQWLELERERYRQAYCRAVMTLAEDEAAKGNQQAAKKWTFAAVATAPFDEALHRSVLRVLDRLGDRAAVIHRHNEFVQRLATELDVEPSPETQALLEHLKSRVARTSDPLPTLLAAPESEAVPPSEVADSNQSLAAEARNRFGRWWRPIALTVTVAVLILSFLWARPWDAAGSNSSVVETEVAVFPFVVEGTTNAEYLGNGVMDLLSYAVDGVGQVRRVDPFALIRYLEKHDYSTIGPEEGKEIALHFGAGRYVLGRVLQLDSGVRLSASVYDVESGDPVSSVATAGNTKDLSNVVEELAVRVMASLPAGRGARLDAPRTVHAANFDALRAYLIGEDFWRRGWPDSALPYLRDAVGFDSTFALAWYRIAVVEGFNDWSGGVYPSEQAMRYRQVLPARDQMLVEAWYAFWHGDGAQSESIAAELTRQFPDHVEAWEILGNIRQFYSWQYGRRITDAWEPIARALNLEPDHPLVSWRAVFASMHRGEYDEAASYVAHMVHGGGGSSWLPIMPDILAYQRGDVAALDRLLNIVDDAAPFTVFNAGFVTAGGTDSLVAAREIYERLTWEGRAPPARSLGFLHLAHLEVARGRWRAARTEFDSAYALAPDLSLIYGAWLAAAPFLRLPRHELTAIRDSVARWDAPDHTESLKNPTPRTEECRLADDSELDTPGLQWFLRLPKELPASAMKLYLLGLLSARIDENAQAERFAADLQRMTCPLDAVVLRSDLALEIRALAAWQAGQFSEAVQLLGGLSLRVSEWADLFAPVNHRPFGRFVLAESLAELGRTEEALGWHSSWRVSWGTEYVWQAPAAWRVGQLLERDQPDEAAHAYESFIARWRNADPSLQPQVALAERRLAALDRGARR